MLIIPAELQTTIFSHESFWNWNKFRKNVIFKIKARKRMAPPVTHNTALFGVAIILKILSVHDLFVSMTEMFETIRVIKAIARTSFAWYPK